MNQRNAQRVASFWWQGLLIVLPTVVLAAVGFRALRQDQRLVEQEARQRAAEMARDLSARLGRPLAGVLSEFELTANGWFGAGIHGGTVPWPGRSRLTAEEQERYRLRMADWQADYPGVHPSDVFPVEARFSETGRLEWPPDYPLVPTPPSWLDEFSPEQKALWDKATAALHQNADADVVRMAFEEFLASRPSASAKAVANFALLSFNVRTNAPTERMARLLKFGQVCGAELTEGGLPLKAVVLAQALRDAAESGLTEELFDELTGWKGGDFRSVLTPLLLTQAETLAARQAPAVRDAVLELRQRWEGSERLRGLAQRAQEILRPTTLLTTNLWLDSGDRRWFAILDPSTLTSPALVNGQQSNVVVGHFTRIRFFPKAAVQRATEQAMSKLEVALPPYFGLRVSLENAIVLEPKTGAPAQPWMALARSDGQLSQPAVTMLGRNADGSPKFGREFESLPSHPRLAVEIGLTQAPLLYAHARQRALLFGATILAASVAALAGWVTARRAFLRQLRLNELKSNFVSSVSHELRAPIASVRLLAEGLENGRIQDERKKRDYFKFIVQECRRLTALIENVLDFSRIEQGRKQYEFEPTDLVALAQHTVKLMETYAAERGVTLELKLNDAQLLGSPKQPGAAPRREDGSDGDSNQNSQLLGPPKRSDGGSTPNSQLSLDGRAIQQALVNLIDNALKHSPKGSTVTVGLDFLPARKAESKITNYESRITNPASRFTPCVSRVQLWVEDHGPGIPPEEHERIFEKFYRLGSELRRETPGVGIGLSIVRHIVEAHGGKVTVRSAVGEGSRFTIELPVTDSPSQ